MTELITTLLEAKEDASLLAVAGFLEEAGPVDPGRIGYVPASKAGAEFLFDVIATAYECQSVIVTSNLPFEECRSYCVSLGARTGHRWAR